MRYLVLLLVSVMAALAQPNQTSPPVRPQCTATRTTNCTPVIGTDGAMIPAGAGGGGGGGTTISGGDVTVNGTTATGTGLNGTDLSGVGTCILLNTAGAPSGAAAANLPHPPYTTVSFSATPTFSAASATNIAAFTIALTGNVTSSTLSGASVGQFLVFRICQDSS